MKRRNDKYHFFCGLRPFVFIAILSLLFATKLLYAQSSIPPTAKYVPGELIVSLKPEAASSLNDAIRLKTFQSLLTNGKSLDSLIRKYGGFEHINPRRIVQGSALNAQQMAEGVQQKFPRHAGYYGYNPVSVPDVVNVFVFKITGDVAQAARDFHHNQYVVYAEPNYLYRLSFIPNDPAYPGNDAAVPDQWALPKMKADLAWDKFNDLSEIGQGVTVAVLDSGVQYFFEEIAENIWINAGEFPADKFPEIDVNADGVISFEELRQNGLTDTNGDGMIRLDDLLKSKFADKVDNDGNGFVDDLVGWDFGLQDNDPAESVDIKHGTYVAHIIAAQGNDGVNMAGMAWNSQVMPIKGLNENDLDNLVKSSDMAAGVIYAVNNGADIITASIFDAPASTPAALLQDAAIYATNLGVVFIAAAGNNHNNFLNYPAAYNAVIAVAATNSDDRLADFSNYGEWIDVAAPGVAIYSSDKEVNGTSFSAPHVAGLAALIASYHSGLGTGIMRVEKIEQLIKQTTDPVSGNFSIETGRINAFRALDTSPEQILLARITSPGQIMISNQSPINIEGIADGPPGVFDSYSLYSETFSVGGGEKKVLVENRKTPVNNGILYEGWDVRQYSEALVKFELVVKSTTGQKISHFITQHIFNPKAFYRGDANNDDSINLSDVVYTLSYLFKAEASPQCRDAADVNDDGSVDLSDAVATLFFLFVPNAAPPASPYPFRGEDPTGDTLGCWE